MIKTFLMNKKCTLFSLIGEGPFSNCKQLKTIEIPKDSRLQTIYKKTFSSTKDKNIIIPSSVTLIDEGA